MTSGDFTNILHSENEVVPFDWINLCSLANFFIVYVLQTDFLKNGLNLGSMFRSKSIL